MRSRESIIIMLVMAWVLATSFPAFAQVRRVVVEAEGLSKACTPGLETALKSLEFIDKYDISVEKQMFWVTYYDGEKFQPKQLHWATDKGEAEVRKLHVSAVGKVHNEGDRQVFVSGDDRFLIVNHAKLPIDVRLGIMGVVDDAAEPMQMKPDDVEVLTEEPSEKR